MAVLHQKDYDSAKESFDLCRHLLRERKDEEVFSLPTRTIAMAVRFSLFVLEKTHPGDGVELRVPPWGAIKILNGPHSDPHNLTPPDVVEIDWDIWLRLATGVTTWEKEKENGNICILDEREDAIGKLLPLHI